MLSLDFKTLKSNYTTDATDIHACTMSFPNTCAIRMSEALVKTNTKFTEAFKAAATNKCPHSFMRGAQDLAAVLAKATTLGPRKYGWAGNPSATVPAEAKGKKGIICFMQIPGFDGQGHIDLWDGEYAVGSDYWDAQTIWLWTLP